MRRQPPPSGPARCPRSGAWGSDTARSWLGRQRPVVAAGAVDHVGQRRAVRWRRSAAANEAPGLGLQAVRHGSASRPSRPSSPHTAASPFTHSALTSTGLPGPGGDRPAVDPGVHPRQSPALGALGEQPVGGVDPDPEAGAGDVVVHDAESGRRPARRPGRGRRSPRRGDRARGGTTASRRPCCTRCRRRRRCWPASPRTARPAAADEQLAALVGPAGRERAGPRRRSSCRGTSRRTTGSRRRPSVRPRPAGRRPRPAARRRRQSARCPPAGPPPRPVCVRRPRCWPQAAAATPGRRPRPSTSVVRPRARARPRSGRRTRDPRPRSGPGRPPPGPGHPGTRLPRGSKPGPRTR